MKIGIYCGTFNPPHIGHLLLPLLACHRFKFPLVYFIPSAIPVNKPEAKDMAYHRYEMIKNACSDIPFFEVDDFEIKTNSIVYTYQTVEYIRNKTNLKKDDLYLFVGEDWVANLDKWVHFDYIKENANLLIFRRRYELYEINMDYENNKVLDNHKTSLLLVQKLKDLGYKKDDFLILEERIDLSSTFIRNCIENHDFYKSYVPESVYTYINEKGLYL